MSNSLAPSASQRWHKWVAEHPVGSLALIGVIATQLGTYFGYCFQAIGLPRLPWPAFNGALVGGADTWGSPVSQYWAGQSIHFVNGVIFAILFGVIAHKQIPVKGHVAKGLIYGVVMTIISMGVLVPYAYAPKQGYGLFCFSGPDGWKLPAGVLLWHLIYGAVIGLLYQPKDEN
ncbi:MAG: hypothetical protein RL726_1536 [Actinomycetota bacterium]|jgi:hypothetical protein